mgnify:CR=1 FL=1
MKTALQEKLTAMQVKVDANVKAAQEKTKLKDAVRTAVGKSLGKDLVIACMDFSFIGGSMGSVVGEKIARGIQSAIKNKTIEVEPTKPLNTNNLRWVPNTGIPLLSRKPKVKKREPSDLKKTI